MLVAGLSYLHFANADKLQVYFDDTLIRGQVAVSQSSLRVMPTTVDDFLLIPLHIAASGTTEITVDFGELLSTTVSVEEAQSEGKCMQASQDTAFFWRIKNAQKEETYTMHLSGRRTELVILLRYSPEDEVWVIETTE